MHLKDHTLPADFMQLVLTECALLNKIFEC